MEQEAWFKSKVYLCYHERKSFLIIGNYNYRIVDAKNAKFNKSNFTLEQWFKIN